MIKVSISGASKAFSALRRIGLASKVAAQATDEVARETLDEIAEDFRNSIRDQGGPVGLRLRNLSDEWQKRKNSAGLNPGTLIASEGYVNSIISRHEPGTYKIVTTGAPVPGGDITYNELARHLEYGTRRIPAIPHWETLEEYAKDKLRSTVKTEVSNALRRG